MTAVDRIAEKLGEAAKRAERERQAGLRGDRLPEASPLASAASTSPPEVAREGAQIAGDTYADEAEERRREMHEEKLAYERQSADEQRALGL